MAQSKEIISAIENREAFLDVLKNNPGLIVIKLGAEWCGPCKKINHLVHGFFVSSPPEVLCADLDVDECTDLYSFLKQKKMVNGIPAILLYKKGNRSYIPDDSVTGANPPDLHAFFTRAGNYHANIVKQVRAQDTKVKEYIKLAATNNSIIDKR
jgi:thioredoxin-like negative regulator of GroEL